MDTDIFDTEIVQQSRKKPYILRDNRCTQVGRRITIPVVIPLPLGTSLHAFGDTEKAIPFPIHALQQPLKVSINENSFHGFIPEK